MVRSRSDGNTVGRHSRPFTSIHGFCSAPHNFPNWSDAYRTSCHSMRSTVRYASDPIALLLQSVGSVVSNMAAMEAAFSRETRVVQPWSLPAPGLRTSPEASAIVLFSFMSINSLACQVQHLGEQQEVQHRLSGCRRISPTRCPAEWSMQHRPLKGLSHPEYARCHFRR